MHRKNNSFVLRVLFLVFEYSTLVAFAFLHVCPGKWLFRTPAVYTGTGVLWTGLFAWSTWGFGFIDTLNRIDFLRDWFKGGSEFIYHQIPNWLWIAAILIPIAFLIQHLFLAGRLKEQDDIYNGYPWLLAVFRLITFRKPLADEKEESFFKEFIEPLFVLSFSLAIINRPLFLWIGIITAISLLSRERMLKHFYEVNRVNTQDVISRAEEIAEGAGMTLASKRRQRPVVGRINPSLLKKKAPSDPEQKAQRAAAFAARKGR